MARRNGTGGMLLVGLLVAVCSAISSPAAEASQLSGTWQGRWESHTTGHQGPLSAQLTPISDTQYLAEFRGRFFRILPFRYEVVLEVVEADEQTVRLAGSSYLGRLFGTFTYEAQVTDDGFQATYRSCKDCGTFTLRRCCGRPCCAR